MAAALRVVGYPGLRAQHHFMAQQPQPAANIHVFVVQEIALIETAQSFKNATWKQHEHPAHPIRVDWRIVYRIVGTPASTKDLAQYFERTRKTAGTVLNFTVFTQYKRRHHANR